MIFSKLKNKIDKWLDEKNTIAINEELFITANNYSYIMIILIITWLIHLFAKILW